ncbi:hypothetical protein ACIQD3_04515 [Peribacillus loiseleuriae]|uniref:hypothetical protein n=1 Tax=Peribacillus loiseleuriae TaxID=1679170 RepID=UPI003828B5DC
MKYLKLVLSLSIIASLLLTGLETTFAKEKKLTGMTVVTNKDHPRYCDSEKKFKEYKRKAKKGLVSIGHYEYNDKSILHVDNSDKKCISNIEIYIDHTKKNRIKSEQAIKIAKNYLIKKKNLEKYYKEPEFKKLRDPDNGMIYDVISYHHKDYYNNNPKNYPGSIYAYTESDERGVKLIRISWSTPRYFNQFETID